MMDISLQYISITLDFSFCYEVVFFIFFGCKFILYDYSIILGDDLIILCGFVMMVCSNFNILCSNIIILCNYNHFHNVLRLFDVLTNFSFTTSETMRDYYL